MVGWLRLKDKDLITYASKSIHRLSLVHVPSNLPTITEQSITAALTKKEEDRPKVTDIFPTPEIQVPESEARRPSHRERKLSGRMRNTSGETPTSRFQVMPSIQIVVKILDCPTPL